MHGGCQPNPGPRQFTLTLVDAMKGWNVNRDSPLGSHIELWKVVHIGVLPECDIQALRHATFNPGYDSYPITGLPCFSFLMFVVLDSELFRQ